MKLHGSRRTFGRWTCTAGHVEWDDCEWCLGFSRWSPVKSWKAWDSTRIHEILIPWCIKMYQDVPRCWWRLMYLKTIEHYLYQYLYEWNGHWNSKKSFDVFCHIHELNCLWHVFLNFLFHIWWQYWHLFWVALKTEPLAGVVFLDVVSLHCLNQWNCKYCTLPLI